MQAFGLLPPGVMLDHPFFRQVPQVETPTSSADEADMMKKAVLKSPLAKNDQISVALPSQSEDSAAPGVESPPAVDQPPPPLAPPTCGPSTTTATTATATTSAAAAAAITATAAAAPAASGRSGPQPWLMGLFHASLFDHHGCRCHPGIVRNGTLKRNENNQYCLACTHTHATGMCKLCLPDHAASCPGRVFQIRKYMYQTCVHVDDIQPLYDVSGVQAYCINSRRAVLIHPKNVEKEQKCPAFDNSCSGCHKPLRHDCTYCSLRCKVDVEFGFAPITPKGSAAVHDSSVAAAAAAAAMTAAAAMAAMPAPPRQPPAASRSAAAAAGGKRSVCTAGTAGTAAAAAAAAARTASLLDVSHATLCSSGAECVSSRSKRRKAERPERSHFS